MPVSETEISIWEISTVLTSSITCDTTLKYVGHQMIMIIQCSEFLDLARGKKNKLTASLWRDSQELYYQTAAARSRRSKHAAQVFVILLALLVIFSLLSHICDAQHPILLLPDQSHDWLPDLLSNFVQNAATLLWVTAFTAELVCHCLTEEERKSKWEVQNETGLFHAQREWRIETEKTRGQKSRESHRRPAILRVSQREERDRASRVYSYTTTAGFPLFYNLRLR